MDWKKHVHDGFVADRKLATSVVQVGPLPTFRPNDSQLSGSKRGRNELEVVFHYSSATYDGRFANNAWLQETPDFLTKVTWDNYALVSPETADTLGLKNDTMITVKIGDRSVDVCCYTMPGQARYSIGLVLGGGRTEAGHVATHPHNVSSAAPPKRVVGWDTYKVRTTAGFDIATGCSATGGGAHYELADVQDHWDYRPGLMPDIGREAIAERAPKLIRETTAASPNLPLAEDEYWNDSDQEGKHKLRHLSLFEEHEYHGHRWGMAIDLNTCTGCNACMVACQSENNVPVVGRQEVINNREMSWIRIDRYFQGDRRRSARRPSAARLPAVRERAVRAGLPGRCDPALRRRPQRHGLQPLHRHAVLREQLSVQGAAIQLPRLEQGVPRGAREGPPAAVQPGRHGAHARRDGEVHVSACSGSRTRRSRRRPRSAAASARARSQARSKMARSRPRVRARARPRRSCSAISRTRTAASRCSTPDRRAYELLGSEVYTKPRTRYLARVRNIRTPDGSRWSGQMSTAEGTADHGDGPGKARETFRAITRDVSWVAEAPKPHKLWLVALAISIMLFGVGIYSIYKVVWTGIGVWGNSNTVCWAWDITNFVWWIGIGHAGTLISAVLYLTRQHWRVSINRSAEAMTIFAVMAAGLFPLLHTGRPWFAWWMIPLPNDMGSMWPQFRSPLMWDVFAVTTYLTTSVLFWYMGMVPDLATFRDRNAQKGNSLKAGIYGVLALGWRGSARQWHRYERAYLILAGLATPLVFSVHSRRVVRLRDVAAPRLAHDDLPAVLRRRRDLLRLRDGDDVDVAAAVPVQPPAHHQARAHRRDVQGDDGDGHDGLDGLHDRVLHRLVLGQRVRAVHVPQPLLRAVLVGVVADDVLLQRRRAALLLEQVGQEPGRRDLDPLHLREHRNVG